MGVKVAAGIDQVPASGDNPSGVLVEANRVLLTAEAGLGQFVDRAAALAAQATRERAELQRFLEEFALEQSIFGQRAGGSDESGALIDTAALQRGSQELADGLQRAIALNANLTTALNVIRGVREQLSPERAFRDVQETADVRLQQAMNSAREDERRRLAREVHDGPAQVMANAIFAIEIAEQIARRAPDQVAEELSRVRLLLKDGVAEIRRFMFDLRPTMLQDQGLSPTLRRYIDDYNRFFGKRVQLHISASLPGLSDDQELTVFRTVQESLQNIHKHAMTDDAIVELGEDSGLASVTLVIADQGRGFRPAAQVPRAGSGAGLPGMKERAKLIGANLTIQSEPSAGTVVRLVMPLRQRPGAPEQVP